MSNETSMNPDITTTVVGIRKLREVTIYPLSVHDQLKATEIITDVINTFSTFTELEDSNVIDAVVGILKPNISAILKLVVDENEEISLSELTNPQLERIVNIIFAANYKEVIKNSQDLIGKMKPLLASMRS